MGAFMRVEKRPFFTDIIALSTKHTNYESLP